MAFPKITKDTIWILVGIDGTGSKDWAKPSGVGATNSHVAKFVRMFDVSESNKKYYDGPGDAGIDTTELHDAALIWIGERLTALIPGWNSEIGKDWINKLGGKYTPSTMKGNMSFIADIRICLVGHSRGGAIAQKIAANLPFRVYFLGLFDSVDMAINLLTDDVINVEYTYHAKRNPKMDSRSIFGNTGNASIDGYFESQMFMTSHGGIGGSYVDEVLGVTSDYSCTSAPTIKLGIPTPVDKLSKNYSSSSYLPSVPPMPPYVMYTKVSNIADICAEGSIKAWSFIENAATTRGLPMICENKT